jgi:hypothetical protein
MSRKQFEAMNKNVPFLSRGAAGGMKLISLSATQF